MTSDRCVDEKYWDSSKHKCKLCETKYPIKKGYEFTENCGWSDTQQQVDLSHKKCSDGTFNDGSQVKCKKCSSCLPSEFIASACTSESDSICCGHGEQIVNGQCVPQPLPTTTVDLKTTTAYMTTKTTAPVASSSSFLNSTQLLYQSSSESHHSTISTQISFRTSSQSYDLTGIYVCLGIVSAFSLVCLLLVIKWRRTKRFNEEFQRRCNEAIGESLSRKGINRFQQSVSYNIIQDTGNDHVTGLPHLLAAEVQSAPLKTVLDNLDVLEELVLVLDPDISGAKNTRHLAAQCSFSFAWINYAYSMKDHKSPLVAVLEGVVTKNPDWTVAHFAELLTAIGRNDAVEILAKLPVGVQE